jgi:hypothetical protein
VTFSTWAEAEAALEAVNGVVTLPGSGHALAVKFADAKPGELAKFEARGTKRGAWEMGCGAAAMMGMIGAGGAGAGAGAVGGGGSGKRQFMGGMGRGGMPVSCCFGALVGCEKGQPCRASRPASAPTPLGLCPMAPNPPTCCRP